MARIVSVTFEATSHARSGHFSIPRHVAAVLGIRDGDSIELRVSWEGRQVEASTRLASGLEVYYRQSDPTTVGLEAVPGKTPLLVTVWRSTEARETEEGAEVRRVVAWDAEEFRRAFVEERGSGEPLTALTEWAGSRRLTHHRFGSGSTGPMYFDVDHGAGTVVLCSVSVRGSLEIVWRDNLDKARPFLTHSGRLDILRRMNSELGLDRPERVADTWLSVGPQILMDTSNRDRLLAILDSMIERLRG